MPIIRALVVAGSAAAIFTAPLQAQSIEQSYADQCAEGQQNETCDLLRRAMLDKLSGQSSSGPAVADAKAVQEIAAPKWGLFLDLIKERHVYVLGKGMRDIAYSSPIVTYSWHEPGKVIRVSNELPSSPETEVSTLHWDPERGAVIEKTIAGGAEVELTPQADGSFVTERGQARVSFRKTQHGVEQVVEAKSPKGWDLLWRYDLVPFTPETLGLLRQIHENNVTVAKINASIPAKYHDPEYLRQAQEEERQRQARKKSNGGLFGALVGAAVGAYAGSAAGMDATQTATLMMRGAAAASPNSGIAQGLAKGWAEEAAKQDSMQQSMDDARASVLAQNSADGTGDAGVSYGQADTAANTGTASATSQAGSAASQGSGLTTKSVRVWLAIGMEATNRNTINPSCFSDTFTVDVQWDPKGWGNNGRVAEAVAPLESAFIAKCSQHGKPTSSAPRFLAEGLQDGFSTRPQDPQHFYVTM